MPHTVGWVSQARVASAVPSPPPFPYHPPFRPLDFLQWRAKITRMKESKAPEGKIPRGKEHIHIQQRDIITAKESSVKTQQGNSTSTH